MNVPSNLSNAEYGYDFVVATTQAGINGTMRNFLSKLTEPVVNICYVADSKGDPIPIDYDTLKAKAKGSDPFAVPDTADPNEDQNLKNLMGARFMMGFRARLGLPHVPNPSKLPDIVTLGSDTSAVTFNMLCSTFEVVQLTPPSGYAPPSWMNKAQDPKSPWVFTSKVDLRFSEVAKNAYSTLPPDVQKKIKNLGSAAFSVQQLLYDLSTATLMTVPTITGVKSGTKIYSVLEQYFIGGYFTQMQKDGQPLLGCSIVANSAPVATMQPTALNLEVNPYLDPSGQPYPKPTAEQQQLATLNYLCAIGDKSLPPAVKFGWNWLDASQISDHDGVVSINRNALVNYFRTQLAGYAKSNCLLMKVRVGLSSGGNSWSAIGGQMPTIATPGTGSTVLTFNHTSNSTDQAGVNGAIAKLTLTNTYSMSVEFSGTTIVVTQHQVVYMYVRALTESGSGNIIDKTIIDTYTIGVDASGRLVTSLNSKSTDTSYDPKVNSSLSFYNLLEAVIKAMKDAMSFVNTNLQDIPISVVQDFVFPGGQTFLFKNVGFSGFQDLVSYISYADPSAAAAVAVPAHPLGGFAQITSA